MTQKWFYNQALFATLLISKLFLYKRKTTIFDFWPGISQNDAIRTTSKYIQVIEPNIGYQKNKKFWKSVGDVWRKTALTSIYPNKNGKVASNAVEDQVISQPIHSYDYFQL